MGTRENGHRPLGPLEGEVMRALWAVHEPQTVRAVLEQINRDRKVPLAYTTVMTVLSRLADKEIVRRRRVGRGYTYEAAVSDEAEIAVREVVRDFGDAAVTHFVAEARGDPQLRHRLQRLLEEDG